MTPEETIKRKLKLNGQSIKLIRGEMRKFVHLKNLLGFEKFLKSKITPDFDQGLSARLDAVRFLIESFETGGVVLWDPCGEACTSPDPAFPLPMQGGQNGAEKTD